MKYHAHVSPRLLLTAPPDLLSGYPERDELRLWYTCLRKVPYETEAIALLIAEGREGYQHFPCEVDPSHWHVGRGGNRADPRKLAQRAKRSYRRAVRDEIWRDHVVRKQQEEKDLGTPDT